MSRSHPWRRVCPDDIQQRFQRIRNGDVRCLFVAQSGPTGFMIKQDGLERPFRVLLGSPNKCSCKTFLKSNELCIHILWVLTRQLRVPESNPIIWQLALIDREINELLRGAERLAHASRRVQLDSAAASGGHGDQCSSGGLTLVPKREVTEEDVCPICQCELLGDDSPTVYCHYGCGSSIHSACMREWAKYAKSQHQDVSCPLCRTEFGSHDEVRKMVFAQTERDVRAERRVLHRGTTCKVCRQSPIEGSLYMCTTCALYRLCHTCFSANHHSHHNFLVIEAPKAQPRPVNRNVLPEQLMQQLQGRDLTDEDYHTLLLLDQPTDERLITLEQLNTLCPVQRHSHISATSPQETRSTCSICTVAFVPDTHVRQLTCNHIFHKSCIDPYVTQQRSVCPLDGFRLPISDTDPPTSRSSTRAATSVDTLPPVLSNATALLDASAEQTNSHQRLDHNTRPRRRRASRTTSSARTRIASAPLTALNLSGHGLSRNVSAPLPPHRRGRDSGREAQQRLRQPAHHPARLSGALTTGLIVTQPISLARESGDSTSSVGKRREASEPSSAVPRLQRGRARLASRQRTTAQPAISTQHQDRSSFHAGPDSTTAAATTTTASTQSAATPPSLSIANHFVPLLPLPSPSSTVPGSHPATSLSRPTSSPLSPTMFTAELGDVPSVPIVSPLSSMRDRIASHRRSKTLSQRANTKTKPRSHTTPSSLVVEGRANKPDETEPSGVQSLFNFSSRSAASSRTLPAKTSALTTARAPGRLPPLHPAKQVVDHKPTLIRGRPSVHHWRLVHQQEPEAPTSTRSSSAMAIHGHS
eukprot:m.271247 g.271247  ORF g.271247 m.271247 type:complete len:814 (+) comp15683_c1_seq4:1540-3981(+)